MWNLPAPPGFQGLHPDKPVTVYQRHLPHWRQDGATYFVSYRLADSLPQGKLDELACLKAEWERRHSGARPKAALEELARQVQERVERWLDQGMGSCLLKDPALAAFVTSAMHHFDGERYELGCYVVMPNHAHVIVRPLLPEAHDLEAIVGSWKKYSARRLNREVRRTGELWQDESYDRIIRDEEHLWRAIQYIGSNPSRAGLPRESCLLWIRPEWVALGWKFESAELGAACRGVRTARESRPTLPSRPQGRRRVGVGWLSRPVLPPWPSHPPEQLARRRKDTRTDVARGLRRERSRTQIRAPCPDSGDGGSGGRLSGHESGLSPPGSMRP
jgi:REP element-mobilizing transposase RayT